jgi:type IV secretory pathway component VirB8
VCVVLCAVFRLIVVLFCVMCVICVLCLIVVPLPPSENPFAVKINNNNKNYNIVVTIQREIKKHVILTAAQHRYRVKIIVIMYCKLLFVSMQFWVINSSTIFEL